MSDHLPAPLVPAEVDLRGLEYMPLYGDRLFKSETWKKAEPEARCAMLRLWWHSFAHESPAGSLPDDDTLLADYAGYGDAVRPWLRVREQALRRWQKCSDGRLYHHVVAGIALDAWEFRKAASARGKLGASNRWAKHKHEKAMHTHDKSMAQASKPDSASNARAIEKNGKRSEVKEKKDLDLDLNHPTRHSPVQKLLKKMPSDQGQSPEETERRRRIGEACAAGNIALAERIRAGEA